MSDPTFDPEFATGDVLEIDGEEYTVTQIDPSRSGVRAYHLTQEGSDEQVRLQPRSGGVFGFIRVASITTDQIEDVSNGE